MQAISRLRLLADLVKADILPANALHRIVDLAGSRGSGSAVPHPFRAHIARYVALCPAIDPPAWIHTSNGQGTAYAASPALQEIRSRPDIVRTTLPQTAASFGAYLNLPAGKPSHLTYIVKKCKELAVVLLNSGRSSTAASDFFSSISSLLGQHQHLQNPIFLVACACSAVQVAETAQARGIWVWEQTSQLVQALCNQLHTSWRKLDAFTAVNMFQTLAKCHLQHGPMPQPHLDAAAAQISGQHKWLQQQGVSLAAWACASIHQRTDPTRYHPLLDQLAAQAMREPSGSFTLQHAATIIWSMSRSHYHPPETLLHKLTWCACFQLDQASSQVAQDLEMLLLGYAWLGFAPPPEPMQVLLGHILQQPLKSHQAANIAWSLAVLGQLDLPVFERLLVHVNSLHMEDTKISRQLHFALDFLQPETVHDPGFDEWQQVSEELHQFWPVQPYDKKTRTIHSEVLGMLEEGLGLQCRKDVSITRDHDHSLFTMDILIEQQAGVPHDIAVQVDGPDSFLHNKEAQKRCVGPVNFRDSMLLRHVPCLIKIPYFEWNGLNQHSAFVYLQDKLKEAGTTLLSGSLLPE